MLAVGLCGALVAASDPAATLKGSGSSLLCPLMKTWSALYREEANITIEYDCVGSGNGRRALLGNETHFAGTDSVFEDAEFEAHSDLQMIPIVAEAVVVLFSLPEVANIVLDRVTLGRIFIGSIHFWDDPEIARWNPALTLPHEPIRVHVRSGSSGTTSIFTKALVAFGTWNATRGAGNTWYTDDELPHPGMNLTRVKGSSGMLAAVKDTPYSIGYSGQTGTVAKRLPYASVVNRAGQVALAGQIGGRSNIDSLALHPARLTGELVDLLGYPIAGLSYLAVKKDSPMACTAVQFAMWVLRGGAGLHQSGQSRVFRLYGELATSLGADQVELVLTRVMMQTCTAQDGAPTQVLPLAVDDELSHLARSMRAIGYEYNVRHSPDLVVASLAETSGLHGSSSARLSFPQLRMEDALTPPSGVTSFPVAMGTLVLCAHVSMTGGLKNLQMGLGVIEALLRGEVVSWADPAITSQNDFVLDSYNVTWMAERTMAFHNVVLNALGVPQSAAVLPSQLFGSLNDVGQNVRAIHGAVAVLPPAIADAWGLITIVPTVGGEPLLSDPASLEAQLRILASRTGRLPWEEAREEHVYPFYTTSSVWVPTQLVPSDGAVQFSCSEAQKQVYPFLKWLIQGGSADTFRENGFAPVYRVVAATMDHPNGTGLRQQWGRLRCGDAYAYPEDAPAGEDGNVLETVAAVLVALVVCTAVGVGFFHRAKNRRAERMTQYAPKSGPVALVFTDILKSSELWGKHPEAMEVALKAHHRVLRKVLSDNRGYEVKTIGDAFMVAFDNPTSAVNFMMASQLALLEVAWPPALLAHPACEIVTNSKGQRVFAGLRVRMGCHFGKPSVRKTPQGGYDYDGADVNIAARVSDSGAGGQILITEDVYSAIEGDLDDMQYAVDVDYLGNYCFKGIDVPQGVYGVLPLRVQGRGEVMEAIRGVTEVRAAGAHHQGSTSNAGSDRVDAHRLRARAMQAVRKWISDYGKQGAPAEDLAVAFKAGCDGLQMTETQVVMLVLKWSVDAAHKIKAVVQDGRSSLNSSSQIGRRLSLQQSQFAGDVDATSQTPSSSLGSPKKRSRVAPYVTPDSPLPQHAEVGLRWPAVAALLQSFPVAAVVSIAEATQDRQVLQAQINEMYLRISVTPAALALGAAVLHESPTSRVLPPNPISLDP